MNNPDLTAFTQQKKQFKSHRECASFLPISRAESTLLYLLLLYINNVCEVTVKFDKRIITLSTSEGGAEPNTR